MILKYVHYDFIAYNIFIIHLKVFAKYSETFAISITNLKTFDFERLKPIVLSQSKSSFG